MIISASRRTDIPAFFGNHFLKSLEQGEFTVENPFNKKKKIINFNFDLLTGIVFWTKNPENFLNHIQKIHSYGIPFYFQFTINNYPKKIEPHLPQVEERIEILKELYNITRCAIVWRYDPIILTENYNLSFHIENFSFIMGRIHTHIHHITVSMLTLYRKIIKNFKNIISDTTMKEKLLLNLKQIADSYNKRLDICCYNIHGIPSSKCIDASLFGKNITSVKASGQRKMCNCDQSLDIGYYRTCKHNCLYCYAK
jgi:DNA repair photolyase